MFIIFDFDGGSLIVPRSSLTTAEFDITFSSGGGSDESAIKYDQYADGGFYPSPSTTLGNEITTDDHSFSFWFKRTASLGSWTSLMSFTGELSEVALSTHEIRMVESSSVGTGVTTVQDQYYHVVVSTASGTKTIYVDGVSKTTQGASSLSAKAFALGEIPSSGYQSKDIVINNFEVWDKALSGAEVTELYNSGSYLEASEHSAYAASCTHAYLMGGGDNDTATSIEDQVGSMDLTYSGTADKVSVVTGMAG